MLFILLAILCVYTVRSSHKNRHKALSRITKYDLIHITPQQIGSVTMLEFDAFNQHYKVELTRNDDMIAANIRHTNIDPTQHKHQYLSSSTVSCHYHGRVLNTDSSVVSMALCPHRGIRGRITAFNETLIIQPSAYYLDLEKDRQCTHELSDELLVYRLSDFNTSDVIGRAEGIPLDTKPVFKSEEAGHRRLYSSSNVGKTEMAIVTGPVRVNNYKTDYGDQWYQSLLGDYQTMVNDISAIYLDTNWGSSVGGKGSIGVVLVEMEVITSFVGNYGSLAPDKLYTNCQLGTGRYDDTDNCAINGNKWLGTIKNWVSQYKDTSSFDNLQFISDMKFKWSGNQYSKSRTLGWGYIGTVCSGASSTSDVSVVEDMGGLTAATRTTAHELGHNFGMHHDGQSGEGAGCAADAGLMGYSDGTGFSSCSITSMRNYFSSAGGLTCLGRGYNNGDAIKSNVETGSGSQVTTKQPTTTTTTLRPTLSNGTPYPTPYPTTRSPTTSTTKSPTSASTGCVRIDGVDDYFYDGDWQQRADTYNNKAVYSFTNRYNGDTSYLYYRSDVRINGGTGPTWFIGGSIGTLSINAYCNQLNLMSCTGRFVRYTNQGWTTVSASTIDANCGSDGVFDPSCGGYQCLGVAGLTGYDGQYMQTSECYNNQRVYELSSDAYLCYSDSYSRWIITNTVCSPYQSKMRALSGSQSTSILAGSGWYIKTDTSSSYSWTDEVMVNDCGGNAGFNLEDLACLENNKYSDNLCMFSNNTLWNGDRTFEVYTKLCSNDEPVYHYVVYNDSKLDIVDVGGQEFGDNAQSVYYLHFHHQLKYSDSNETVGQWLISKDEISINSIAICEKDNLLQCTASSWKIETTTLGSKEVHGNNSKFMENGLLLRIIDQYTTIKDGSCESKESVNNNNDGVDNGLIIILVLIILAVIIVIFGYCLWRKCNKSETEKIKKSLGTSNRNQKVQQDDEPDVEVEVSMERDVNQTVTYD